VAASSKGAARHRKRKAIKRELHQQAFEQEWEEHSQLVQQQQQAAQAEPQQQQEAAAEDQQQQQQDDGDAVVDAADGSRATAADATNDELLAEEHCVYTADDDSISPEQQQQANGAQQQQRGPGSPGWQSSVAIITGDFAMQNVLLQMGLRLLTKDGRRIARLTRYALRCSACFTVSREPGRLFCPKCGNLSLDRVEVVVGADGAEYFGVTKRHILRGTRFSLPKPKVSHV
jgi:RNA-binding protein NOB1